MSLNMSKINRCRRGRIKSSQRLHTFIRGIIEAPTDMCAKFSKRAANRELRHIIKYSELLRYYYSK